VLSETAQGLPSHERLSGFALTDEPLPRTRLGKYRRFLLPQLYLQAVGGVRRAARLLGPEDAALLRDPAAAAVWKLLQQRFPSEAIDPDVNLALDLNLDSFGWMQFALLLQDRAGVNLSETDIAEIQTVRDLLRRSIERREAQPAIAIDLDRWLAPRAIFFQALGTALYGLNWIVMRTFFRLRVTGVEHLPGAGAFVITPNHVSFLDAPAIAAALPFRYRNHLYWAGDIHLLFFNALARIIARALQIFPVDPDHPAAALEAASRVLRSGDVPVWFPEGWRSPDGILQRFLPGIGELLRKSNAPAVPAYITGAFEALPRTRRVPRLRQISVTFGPPILASTLFADGMGRSDEEKIANALHDQVLYLQRNRSADGLVSASKSEFTS
jgi:long-chain acyl-CoA synthetase